MAVAFDAAAENLDSTSPDDVSVTVANVANRVAIGFCFASGGIGTPTATFAGNAMTAIGNVSTAGGRLVHVFGIKGDANIPTGSQTMSVTFTNGASSVGVGVMVFNGCDVTTGWQNFNSATRSTSGGSGEWLTKWFDSAKATLRRSTIVRYTNVIEALQGATIGSLPLQKVIAADLEAHCASTKASASTLGLHHAVLSRAFRKAKRDHLVGSNPVPDVEDRPRRERNPDAARENCWSRDETRQFLAHVKTAGAQVAALYGLALDTGKAELCGLAWKHVDLDAVQVAVERQLTKPGPEPEFGPPKNGRSRTITITSETVDLTEGSQAEPGRTQDGKSERIPRSRSGLRQRVWRSQSRFDKLGHPLQANNLAERSLTPLCKAANVKRISIHGLRHTSATLLTGGRRTGARRR